MQNTRTLILESDLLEKVIQLEDQVGNTPMQRFSLPGLNDNVSIFGKQEWKQISGSVKARAAYNIIRKAIEKGELDSSKILLDATSGNTGIAYATIARELDLRVTICLPENASQSRKDILTSLGVEIIFTSKFEGTDGAQIKAREIVNTNPGKYFYADQYKNDNNWKSHYYHTAVEIIEAQPNITHFITGLGTSGTFVGTSRRLKELKPSVKLISLQPDFALHGLEGWKHMETAAVPDIYDPSIADENLEVGTEEAYEMIKLLAQTENIYLSPSSAANLAGAYNYAKGLENAVIVTMLPDGAEKYQDLIKNILQ